MDLEELDPALNIIIRVSDTGWLARDFDNFDLMQRSKGKPVQHALDMTGGKGECENYATVTMNPLAPIFHPDRVNIWSQPADIHALHAVWQTGATDWQGETPSATFLVWLFCPGGGHPRCLYARRTTLYDDVTDWRDRLIHTWRELVVQGIPVEIHVVRPPPEDIEEGITAHIILTQLLPDHTSGVLLTVQDNAVNDGLPFRIAVTVNNPGQLQQVLQISAYSNEQAAFNLRTGTQLLGPNQQFPTRHGQSFHLLVFRQNLPHGWLPPLVPVLPGTDGLGLIQTRAQIVRTASARLTHGTVAHVHGPEDRFAVELDTLVIPIEKDKCAVQLTSGHQDLQIPSYIEIDRPATAAKVEQELTSWGHTCKAIQFGARDKFLCINRQEEGHHYILCNEDSDDSEGCILHSQERPLDTIDLMRLLGTLGYDRAVVLEIEDVGMGHTRVIFCDNDPQFETRLQPPKIRSEWPDWQGDMKPVCNLYPPQSLKACDALHCVETDFNNADVQELLAAGKHFLNTNFDGLDLPEFVQAAVEQPRSETQYDRWLIYTDGSSQSKLRRMAPQQADELGHPDSWAMLVLAESHKPNGSSIVEPIGWCAHPVHYDPAGSCYTHATRIGAEVAEREAMIWAGLWRLTQDSTTPTIFCCDSLTCGNQAFGIMGVGVADESYRLMRGIFQCLERGLPAGHLRLHHVRSHAGDPYNEFVD